MPDLEYPYQIANRQPCRSAEVEANFEAARTVLNAIDDANIGPAGINEIKSGGGWALRMDVTSGHNHDGVNSRMIAGASSTVYGGLRYKICSFSLTSGAVRWSTELNQGTFDLILYVDVYYENGLVGANPGYYLPSIPTGSGWIAGDGFSNRHNGDAGDYGCFAAVDPDSAPPRVWVCQHVYAPATCNYRVMILGT